MPKVEPDMTSPDATTELVRLFFRVSKRLHHRALHQLAPLDLTPSQGRALYEITGATDPLRIADLAGRLNIAPRSATEVVDALEHSGLVNRQPNPADRRTQLLVPTARGQELCAQLTAASAEAGRQLFGRLSADERDQLLGLLGKLDAQV